MIHQYHRTLCWYIELVHWWFSGSLPTKTTCKLHIPRHDGHTLAVDGAKVRVLKQADEVSFCGVLQREDCSGLETNVWLEILCDFSHETLKGKLPNEQVRGLLKLANLAQSDRPRTVSTRLLHATCCGCSLSSCLRRELFPGCFPASALSRCLLRASHWTSNKK